MENARRLNKCMNVRADAVEAVNPPANQHPFELLALALSAHLAEPAKHTANRKRPLPPNPAREPHVI